MVVCHIYHILTRKHPIPREEMWGGQESLLSPFYIREGQFSYKASGRFPIAFDWTGHATSRPVSEPRRDGVSLAWTGYDSFHCHGNEVRAQPGRQRWQLCTSLASSLGRAAEAKPVP